MIVGIILGFLIALFVVSGLVLFNVITGAVVAGSNYFFYSFFVFIFCFVFILLIVIYLVRRIVFIKV